MNDDVDDDNIVTENMQSTHFQLSRMSL